MAIKSMTGFARADGSSATLSWHWELRSVNARGLDVRLRLPPGFEALEPRIRELLAKRITRGSVTVNLNVKRTQGQMQIQLNENALHQVIEALAQLRQAVPTGPPSAEALLGIKGVLEVVEPEESEEEAAARADTMLANLSEALDGMVQARSGEGHRLRAVLADQLASIERLVSTIERSPARTPEAIKQRLKEQVARLLDAGSTLDEGRLYQEAALLATRADTEEELKRLTSHVAAAKELLDSSEPAGRRLDFLAQEFNREANTVCSKAYDVDTTRAGLELKAVIDQLREQVQNIE
jgi:uncharacterized protein (TIGR00255 family)